MDIFEVLAADAKLVEKDMLRVIPRGKKPPEVYNVIWELLSRGGKRFRPSLCLLSCEAVGAKRGQALPIATAIELFHNFTLIHDDIEDCSLLRRGKPALHILYGTPVALNAGDGLFMMVWRSLLSSKLKPGKSLAAQRLLLSAFTEVLEGQARELNWHRLGKWGISKKDYLAMARGKTAALIRGACEAGALAGGAGRREMLALSNFGDNIGVAFQIQDDILNLIGKESKYGKEIGGDIHEGKRTLITIDYLSRAPKKERREMERLLSSGTTSRPKIRRAISLLKKSGAVERAKEAARSHALRAKRSLRLLPDTPARRKMEALADFLLNRDF